MKISNKEKNLLILLASIIIGFLYYQFVYLDQTAQLQDKIKAENDIRQKFETAKSTIDSMEDKKSTVKILNTKISDETEPFYPVINEERLIIELDNLLNDSGLKGGMTFEPIVSSSVEASKKDEKPLAESSLQGIVDEYNHIFKNDEKKQQTDNKTADNSVKSAVKDQQSNNANGTNATSNSNQAGKNDSKDSNKNTIQYLKCEVKFDGDYEALDKFLASIDKNTKKIVVNSIKISSNNSSGIKGSIDLEFYSIPKIKDELESYLKWDINKSYGKDVPFGATSSYDGTSSVGGAGNKSTSTAQENKEPNDFIASIKPTVSDLPTVMIGKANDDLRTTYIYADSNSVENVEMILTQDGDKYYYKYKTSKGNFPANYDGLGSEFVPVSKDIVLDLVSRSRVDENDNSAIKLKVVNKTDKQINININGDDPNRPRVTVDTDLNNVSVNNK